MNSNPLTLSVSCRDNPECVFDNTAIILDITITNSSREDIGVPVKYLQKKGVYCVLIDSATDSKTEMGTSLTPRELKREFTVLKPGQKFMLSHRISADLIRSIGKTEIDLIAKIEMSGQIEIKKNEKLVDFINDASIPIRGKDVHIK